MTSVTDLVKGASSPQEALLAIAEALDELLTRQAAPAKDDGWGSWEPAPQDGESPAAPAPDADHLDVVLKPAAPDKQDARRQFAENVLRLDVALGDCPAAEGWAELYAKGGPVWLYTGNRDLVKQYPYEARQMMLRDVEEDDREQARIMALDVLKRTGDETGFGNQPALAEGTVG